MKVTYTKWKFMLLAIQTLLKEKEQKKLECREYQKTSFQKNLSRIFFY